MALSFPVTLDSMGAGVLLTFPMPRPAGPWRTGHKGTTGVTVPTSAPPTALMTQPQAASARHKETEPTCSPSTMVPRKPLLHQHAASSLVKTGIRAKIQHGKDVKAWKASLEAAQQARDARIAANLEDSEAELAEDAALLAPKPEMANAVTSCVVMKLASFCPNADLRRMLNSMVMQSNVMLAEGYAFANLHVTRLLEQGLPMPKLDQAFFNACLGAVTDCESKYSPEMQASIAAFDALRPAGATKIESSKLHDIRSELANTMAAAACRHLEGNLAKRLTMYLALRYPNVTRTLRKVIVKCVAVDPSVALSKVPQLVLLAKKRREIGERRAFAIDQAKQIIKDLRQRCPSVSSKVHELLPLFHEMMSCVEAAYAASRNDETVDKRHLARLSKARFALLPSKAGYTVSFIPICGRALMGALTRVQDANKIPLAKSKSQDEHAAWRKHFNVNAVETLERMFANRISTDGYAVSVSLQRHQACVLSTTNGDWDAQRIKRENKGKLAVMYAGVDPGVSDVVTVAHTKELQQPGKGEDKSIHASVSSYSASRYAEESKLKASNRRTASWNEETAVEGASVDMETNRSTSQGFGKFLATYLSVFSKLLAHRAKRGYRNMRLMRHVFKQRTVSKICDLIAPSGQYNVVGYGDWKGVGASPIKRRWAGPQQDIKRELQRRRNVLFWNVWEHKTSVTCHATWRRLTNMRAIVTRYDRSTKTWVQSDKRTSVHKVLHCRHSANAKGRQGGGTWNRDANASRNMLMLMMLVVLGVERPREFMPAARERGVEGNEGGAPSAPLSPTRYPSPPLSPEGRKAVRGKCTIEDW